MEISIVYERRLVFYLFILFVWEGARTRPIRTTADLKKNPNKRWKNSSNCSACLGWCHLHHQNKGSFCTSHCCRSNPPTRKVFPCLLVFCEQGNHALVPAHGCTHFPQPISVSGFPTRSLEVLVGLRLGPNVVSAHICTCGCSVLPGGLILRDVVCHAEGVPGAIKTSCRPWCHCSYTHEHWHSCSFGASGSTKVGRGKARWFNHHYLVRRCVCVLGFLFRQSL